MTIQTFLQEKLDEGFTLNRLATILEVSPGTLSKHLNNKIKKVRLSLAKKIYSNFHGVKLDGFLESELNAFFRFDQEFLKWSLNTV